MSHREVKRLALSHRAAPWRGWHRTTFEGSFCHRTARLPTSFFGGGMEFSHHTIHPFIGDNSAAFSTFTKWCSPYHDLFQNILITPRGKSIPISSHLTPAPCPQPLAPTHLPLPLSHSTFFPSLCPTFGIQQLREPQLLLSQIESILQVIMCIAFLQRLKIQQIRPTRGGDREGIKSV